MDGTVTWYLKNLNKDIDQLNDECDSCFEFAVENNETAYCNTCIVSKKLHELESERFSLQEVASK